MNSKFLTVIYDMSQPGMQEKAHNIFDSGDWSAIGWSHAFSDRDEAREALYREQEKQGIEAALARIVKSGTEKDFPGFLEWIADRLVHVHQEGPNLDYVQTLRLRARQMRDALNCRSL